MRRTIVSLLVVVALSMLASCDRDPIHCTGESIGTVDFKPETTNFLGPFRDQSVIIFKNNAGDTMHFTCDTVLRNANVNVEKRCENANLSTHYYYLDGKSYTLIMGKNNAQTGNRLTFLLSALTWNPILAGRNKQRIADDILATVFDTVAPVGAEMYFNFISPADSSVLTESVVGTPKYRFIKDTTIMGTVYPALYEGSLIEGSDPGSVLRFYIEPGMGVAAFRTHSGTLWVRQAVVW